MTIIDEVKAANRIRTDDAGIIGELNGLIAAAKKDLKTSGIKNPAENDPLIKRAIILYTKAHFGFDNDDAERFEASYESLKQHLSSCTEYTEV